jgi:hypothetical protein
MFSITYWAAYYPTNFLFAPKIIIYDSEDNALKEYKNMVIKIIKMNLVSSDFVRALISMASSN